MRRTVEHDKVVTLPVRDGDDIQNIAVCEDLIWSPVASLGVLNTSCSSHKFVLSDAEIAAFNDEYNSSKVREKRISCLLAQICECSL